MRNRQETENSKGRGPSQRGGTETEAERLKSEFFALVSHELRTPLTSIVGYVELLAQFENDQLSARAREFLGIIHRNAERLNGLVQDVLLVAQVEAGDNVIEPDEIDIVDVVSQCQAELEPAAERAGLSLATDVEALPTFAGDPRRLRQAVEHLVSNAIKFTPPGGRVDVRARRADDVCVVEVADTGMGIEEKELTKLFDRFYRSRVSDREHVRGAGLGLAITKAIVEAHGGHVEVESRVGAGSTFRLFLPIRPCEQKSAHQGMARRRHSRAGTPTTAEVGR